jgi:ribosomal protein L37AE/L43A
MTNQDEEETMQTPARLPKPVSYIRCPNCDEIAMRVIAARIWECESCKFRENR